MAHESPDPKRQVCAWCGAEAGAPSNGQRTNYVICAVCLKQRLEQIGGAARPPQGERAGRFRPRRSRRAARLRAGPSR